MHRVARTRTIRDGTGSYWVKHIAENFDCTYPEGEKLGPHYVPNGVLIAAALHVGFKTKSHHDELGYHSLNVTFNMSKSCLEDLDYVIRPDSKRPVKPVPYRSASTICCRFLGVSAKMLVGPQDCWTTSILAMPS